MSPYVKDDIIFYTKLILIIILFISLIIGLAAWILYKSCTAQGEIMGLTTNWGFWTECMVTVDGQTYPLDVYKARTIEQNIRLYKGE